MEARATKIFPRVLCVIVASLHCTNACLWVFCVGTFIRRASVAGYEITECKIRPFNHYYAKNLPGTRANAKKSPPLHRHPCRNPMQHIGTHNSLVTLTAQNCNDLCEYVVRTRLARTVRITFVCELANRTVRTRNVAHSRPLLAQGLTNLLKCPELSDAGMCFDSRWAHSKQNNVYQNMVTITWDHSRHVCREIPEKRRTCE